MLEGTLSGQGYAYPGVDRFEYAGVSPDRPGTLRPRLTRPGLDRLPYNRQRMREQGGNLSLSELREILRSLGIK